MADRDRSPTLPVTLEVRDLDADRSRLTGWDTEVVPLDRGPFRLTRVERDQPDI